MAYDAARGITVLFGGGAFPPGVNLDTWEWNGTVWTQRLVSGPSARSGHAMAYDVGRGVTVLFGGSSFDGSNGNIYGDTWEWNGTVWTLRAVSGPSPRVYHAMAYDEIRRVTVLFGGSDGDTYNGEIWEWDGTAWTQRPVSGPSPRGAIAYDAARGMIVLFGSSGDHSYGAETWSLGGALCPCDWNLNDGINSQDFFDFLAAFFRGSADFNGDGATSSQDFFDFLACFLVGC
jgi:hypothetical protein